MRKTTLCLTCKFGIVRQWEDWLDLPPMDGIQSKCLLSGDFVEVITSCNRYEKVSRKVTYHDPDFKSYEELLLKEAEELFDELDLVKGQSV